MHFSAVLLESQRRKLVFARRLTGEHVNADEVVDSMTSFAPLFINITHRIRQESQKLILFGAARTMLYSNNMQTTTSFSALYYCYWIEREREGDEEREKEGKFFDA